MYLIILSIIGASVIGAFSAKFLLRGSHVSLGFAGGAILGLVFLDIVPEIFEEAVALNIEIHILSIALLCGFLGMHVLEKVSGFHEHGHGEAHSHSGGTTAVGTLSVHALIDGLGIGAAYLVSTGLGTAVIFAFILHKFLDGMNIQAIAQASASKNRRLFLFVNIAVTVFGVLLVSLFSLPTTALLFLTALVGGVLIYVSSSHVLPEAHEYENSWKTIFATLCGVAAVFLLSLIHV
jgi:ZIP family zinc transporter